MLNRLTSAIDFQGQALAMRSERQRLIASNIANADTPGYVARDMDFASALRQATGDAVVGPIGNTTVGTLATTSSAHLDSSTAGGAARSAIGLVYTTASQTNLDRNSVDMDRERAAFADNTIKLEAALRFIGGSSRTMLDAIKGQ